jgi:tripartite-type tricarboxylate transporter receptor subunit TctC
MEGNAMRYVRPVLAAAAVILLPHDACAQQYPSKIVKVVIPWPGGSNDAAGRIVFQKVAESMGQPVVIENRAGASGTIGAAYVAKSAPDGYTVMVTSASHIANAHLYKNLPFDALNDFIGITPLTVQTGILIVHPSLPVKTVKDLIALAKAKPGSINYGSSGSATGTHLSAELFKYMTGIEMVHVPYKGGGPAVQALLGGQVQLNFATIVSVLPHVRSGKLRAVAVTTARRSPSAPDVPTIAESGVPGYDHAPWNGFLAPAKTPRPIIARLNEETARLLRAPDVQPVFTNEGAEPVGNSPEEFAAIIKSETAKWAKVIRAAGIKAD